MLPHHICQRKFIWNCVIIAEYHILLLFPSSYSVYTNFTIVVFLPQFIRRCNSDRHNDGPIQGRSSEPALTAAGFPVFRCSLLPQLQTKHHRRPRHSPIFAIGAPSPVRCNWSNAFPTQQRAPISLDPAFFAFESGRITLLKGSYSVGRSPLLHHSPIVR